MRGLPSLDLIGGPAEGLTVIVTGPTSGIGRETAAELARRGATGGYSMLCCVRSARQPELQKMACTALQKGGAGQHLRVAAMPACALLLFPAQLPSLDPLLQSCWRAAASPRAKL